MWTELIEWIKKLFGKKKTSANREQQSENQKYSEEYSDTKDINFTDIFSSRLAMHTMSDSTAEIPPDNARADFLNTVLSDVWAKSKKIVSLALGVGGVALVPYVKNGKILYNIVTQDRLIINGKDGDKIIDATILADRLIINDRAFYRFTNYTVENNTLYITNKAINSSGAPCVVEEWKEIPDIAISNVDRVLFGFIKSPIDNRKCSDDYGVPVTYGCHKIIDEIKECLDQYKKEFNLKKVKLQVDGRVLDKDPKTGKAIIKDDLFMEGISADGDLFNIFDPAIRDVSFRNRLTDLFSLLEKEVGTSKGILTEPQATYENGEAIRRSVGATFAIVTDIRKAVEKGFADYLYACDVLANFFNLCPQGEYEVQYDWSYSMIESAEESWMQRKELQAAGGLSLAELRAYVTGEDIETAEEKVAEIKEQEPSLSSLLGMDNDAGPVSSSAKRVEEKIDDTVTKTLNGAQTQSLINIVMQFQQGVLTEGQAISIISTSIGVSKEQATELLRA